MAPKPNATLVQSGLATIILLLVNFSVVFIGVSAVSNSKFDTKKSFLKEINNEGPYLGLITVYPPEEHAFFSTKAFHRHPTHPYIDLSGQRFRVGKIHDKKVIYVKCGTGTINAAAATQQMVDMFDVVGIIQFGIAGNANSSLSIGDVTIPKQFAHTGIWAWMNPNGTSPLGSNLATLDFGSFNVPKGEETNRLGQIGFIAEELFYESGRVNVAQNVFWLETSRRWLHLAAKLEGMKLGRCLNSSLCLPTKPKVVVGLRASTSNIFVDNAAYRGYLFNTFGVSSVEMESVAVVMVTCRMIVFRGLSDLAGGQQEQNAINVFGPLAALNAPKS
ncbi:hypothetical protein MKW98_026340 [Papaver atlanticum]|uniref:Nucleoside phosphorylase domain-containing protein n=1 Tax=Papaver atlanticum TaxID=357466 RepID=A0AAD4SQU5_9MAGN|nr:hypothetical protein MKW98_026340 [Papaver atlanticum]